MKAKILLAGLSGLLLTVPALAGPTYVKKGEGSGYIYTAGDKSADDVRVVVSGDEGGVVVLSGNDGAKTRTIRMEANDGRMIFEGEPEPDRPWLGVLLTTTDKGVEINSVMEGSPAERAGIQAGDLIVKADDRDLTGGLSEGGLLEGKGPGDRVRFTVMRDGEEKKIRTRLGSHPGRVEFDIDEELGAFGMAGNLLHDFGNLESLQSLKKLESLKGLSVLPFFDCPDGEDCDPMVISLAQRSKPRLGVVLEGLSPQLAEFFEVNAGEGMLIKEVLDDSAAASAGLQAGDVLVQLDDTKISDLGDVREALSQVEKGDSVRVEVVRRGVRETFRAEIDTEPNPASGSGFSFRSGLSITKEGETGSLQDAREAYQRALEEAERVRSDATAPRARMLYSGELAERQALEEALAKAKREASSNEVGRTF